MEFTFAFATAALVFLIATIIAYVHNSNSIIRKQEKQIARQRTEIFILQAKLHKANFRKASEVIDIHDRSVDPENVPDFGEEW